MLFRLKNLLLLPFRLLMARLFPAAYARLRGVRMTGKVKIYGSSYRMFSSEPFVVALGDPARVIKSTEEWLANTLKDSPDVSHLHGGGKVRAYKRIFGLDQE